MDGILFVNKESGLTSRDVVNEICKIYNTKKVGHTGTLDPIAKGVLVICLGKYTKLVNLLTSNEKEYIAKMRLGIKTDTGDITGKIIEKRDFSLNDIELVFQNFPKKYIQTVPKYSAVKINGKKLYEYAREEIDIHLPTREVNIYNLEILKVENDEVTFKCLVSKGTYIRSLIEDLAEQLNTVGTMIELTRTKQGNVDIANCLLLKEITKDTPLKKIDDVFNYPKMAIEEDLIKKIQNGNPLVLNSDEPILILTYNNQSIAIYQKSDDLYKIIFKII